MLWLDALLDLTGLLGLGLDFTGLGWTCLDLSGLTGFDWT